MKKHPFYFVFSLITTVFVVAEVAFADVPVAKSVPTLSEWGMIVTALGLGLGATYKILKKEK
ncbi:MAG TPA: IPTL-CTERM sorting domain-containing protein [Thermodesulfovibrionales bacterium]|jgi:hypothetical protein|nr:IPTL-CTERM sorting domain-containing protein [Thermodesulfovibrionales bacterium]